MRVDGPSVRRAPAVSVVLGLACALCVPAARAVEYYIAPGGSNSNNGSIGSPWATFDYSIGRISPGDTLYVRGGSYNLASRIRIQKGGASGAPINLWAYPGETPILDFASNPSASDRGIQLERDWWHIRGITVQNAPDNGVWVSGSNNTFEQMVLRWNGDSGLQLSGDSSRQPSNNLILNTDSYENYDPLNHGENADGFAAKFREIGSGNVFRGARAWGNSDDGWDFWAAANGVTVEDSWAFGNGVNIWGDTSFAGDGNGIKLGQDSGTHVVSNMLVWGNVDNGVDVNGNATPNTSISPPHVPHGVSVFHVTSFDNGNRNFRFDENFAHVLRNNISYDGSNSINGPVDDLFNTWNGNPASAADFLSLDDSIARGPRLPDGSLPVSGFLRLASGSRLIDAGIDVGLPYAGAAPDLGAFEAALVLQGDFNNDGSVDASDYTAWRDALGDADETSINNAGDGMNGVDQQDYQVWRSHFGAPSGGMAAVAVPEPAAWLLAVIAAAFAARLARIPGPASVAALMICLPLGASSALAQLPAFPGAEGAGGVFTGAAPAGGWFSNADVYHVTTTEDLMVNGKGAPGTLRGAFVDHSNPSSPKQKVTNRVVVFDVGGTFDISAGALDMKEINNIYIAGQTAPAPVTVYGNTSQITKSNNTLTSNVVLRYMTFRKGTGSGSDSITFSGGNDSGDTVATNMILDHVSASWAEDEIISVANNNTKVTVQYSMINDALVNNHAYGSLIRPRVSSEVTFHHNLYANNASRQARFGTYNGETLTADFRNNVVYNYRDRASYAGGSAEAAQEYADVNFVGNYIVAGPGTLASGDIAFSVDKNIDARVYQSGNYVDPDEAPGGAPSDGVLDGADTGWGMFTINSQTDQTLTQMASPFNLPPVTTQSAPDAYNQVRDYVGNWWWDRDAIDQRVIDNLVDFSGVPLAAAAPIASELNAVLGAPQVHHPAGYDTDGDGMPDAWETEHGLNPSVAGDWKLDFDNDGYINLIEFINDKGAFPAPAPIAFTGDASARYADIMNWKTDDGGVTSGSNWQPSRFDTAVIQSGAVVVDSVGQHAGRLLIAPGASDSATLSVTGGWLMVEEKVEVGSQFGGGVLNITTGGMLIAPVTQVHAMGKLSGAGEVVGDVANGGLVSPGASAGQLVVGGDFVQTSGGVLLIELASASSFDRLLVEGDVTTGGALEVALLNDYAPAEGAEFDILDWSGSKSGAFASLTLPDLANALAWDTSQVESHGVLRVVAGGALLPGDFNADGAVDAADYTVWRDNLGGSFDLNGNGDESGDSAGIVDAADYDWWVANFGASGGVGSPGVGAVPEPAAMLLGLGCSAAAWAARRKRPPN